MSSKTPLRAEAFMFSLMAWAKSRSVSAFGGCSLISSPYKNTISPSSFQLHLAILLDLLKLDVSGKTEERKERGMHLPHMEPWSAVSPCLQSRFSAIFTARNNARQRRSRR